MYEINWKIDCLDLDACYLFGCHKNSLITERTIYCPVHERYVAIFLGHPICESNNRRKVKENIEKEAQGE